MSDPEHEQAGHEVRLGHPESEHFRVSFQPFVRHARVGRGTTLLEAARQAGVGLQSVCGGQSTCNLCVVELDPCVELPAPPEEREALNDVGAGPNARLACKVAVDRDLTVSVPACSLTANQRLHLEALGTPVDIQPAVVSREFVIGDWDGQAAGGTGGAGAREAIAASLGEPVLEACEAVLATLAHVVAMSGSKVQAALHGRALVSLSPPGSPLLGVAIDVGTTKLAAYLVSLETGITLAAAGLMNPQITYGEDVMSRVAYASGSPKKAAELQHVVVMKMNRLIEKLCRAAKACVRDIVDVVAVGNTAMHHLLLGLPVAQLGRAPYRPAATAALDVRASELGLEVGEGVWMHTLPNVAGFVGSDHVAMLLSTL
ncbi:MAG: 2Fe-2S iron-sulfur cluster-binding protein, partial [Actinomycetota bacterium]